MAASVAPPRLTTWTPPGAAARTRSGRLTGIQSPESSTSRRRSGSGSPRWPRCSISMSSSAGTEFQTVTRWPASISVQRAGSRAADGSGSTSAPPAASGPKMS